MTETKKNYSSDDNIRSITFSNKDQVKLQTDILEQIKYQNTLLEAFLKKSSSDRIPF